MKYVWLIIAAVILTIWLSGCESLGYMRSKGAEYYDGALNTAVLWTCNDTSIGAVVRRYGTSQEALDRYIDFCFGGASELFIPVLEPTPVLPGAHAQ